MLVIVHEDVCYAVSTAETQSLIICLIFSSYN